MVANMVFETAKDGGCACYMVEDVPDFALYGYGNNPREAKADMLKAYEEIKELLAEARRAQSLNLCITTT